MDSRKLMIGDKVLVKVLSQIPNTYTVHTWTAEDYFRDLIQVQPIPLTPEILEKNGWKWASRRNDKVGTMDDLFLSGVGHTYFFSDGRSEVDIIGYGIGHSGRGVYRGVINYVHELQHAFRLCGLNELADNFQI